MDRIVACCTDDNPYDRLLGIFDVRKPLAGQGGGLIRKAEKIAGEINSARDYPKATRDLRIDSSVTIYMTVGTDGRARNCRVQRASRDAEADAITCRLAEQRFRFKPATDAAGNPVESTYGWRQKWFYPKPGA